MSQQAIVSGRRIGFFVTCVVDLYRPSAAFAAIKLLEDAGCTVEVPTAQTCCGQPAYNGGDREDAREIARKSIELFEHFDYVVVPSGSCAGMIVHHYPALFENDPEYARRASALAAKTFELVQFLRDVLGVTAVAAKHEGKVTYHHSCSALREMKIKEQPLELLRSVEGLDLRELGNPAECCGFGGTFCVKYPDISEKMVSDKTADIARTGAETVVSGDLGCLLNIAGRLRREGSAVQVRHVAEILAGMTDRPGIGEGEEG